MDLKYRVWSFGRELGRKFRLKRPDNRWGTHPETFFAGARDHSFLFFSPHQDDEVISLGVPIAELTVRGRRDNTHLALCSDGGASGAKHALGDGKECPFHEGPHKQGLSDEEFIAARDNEFVASAAALGVPERNIKILPNRAADGKMSVLEARQMLLSQIAALPDAVVCLIGPSNHGYDQSVQHGDHRVLGQAALDLYNEGAIAKLFFFMEPSGVQNFRVNNPGVRLTRMKASPAAGRLVEAAVAEYMLWDPAEGRHAVGEHSVQRLLRNVVNEQTSYFWAPKRSQVAA